MTGQVGLCDESFGNILTDGGGSGVFVNEIAAYRP